MGCLTCLKVFLILMDVVYGLTGAAVLALGIVWFFKDQILVAVGIGHDTVDAFLNAAGADLTRYMQIAAIVFLVVGSVIIVTCIMACVAVGTMNSVMFTLFLIPLILVMLLNFAIGALIVIEAKPFIGSEPQVKDNMLSMLQSDDYLVNGGYTNLGKAWNILQASNFTTSNGGCCGVYGPDDYDTSKFQKNNAPYQVPVSCCNLTNPAVYNSLSFVPSDAVNYDACNAAAISNSDPSNNLHQQGCVNDSLYKFIYNAVVVGLSIFFAWGGWEFLLFILGVLICCYGRREDKYV